MDALLDPRAALGAPDAFNHAIARVLIEVMKPIVFLGLGNNLIAQGSRSSSPHSTAFFNNVLNTVRTLLTVFGARMASANFSHCTCSLPFRIDSTELIPLGL
jgi:hypothetical protein